MKKTIINPTPKRHLRTCRTCIHCEWKDQYCAAMDSDIGLSFMRSLKACPNYEEHEER